MRQDVCTSAHEEGRQEAFRLLSFISTSGKGPNELLLKRSRGVRSADHMSCPGGAHFRM